MAGFAIQNGDDCRDSMPHGSFENAEIDPGRFRTLMAAQPGSRVTLKTINAELAKRGHNARLEKAGPYFYFFGGEAADWLDRTVAVTTVSSLTLEPWIAEFEKAEEAQRRDFPRTENETIQTISHGMA